MSMSQIATVFSVGLYLLNGTKVDDFFFCNQMVVNSSVLFQQLKLWLNTINDNNI
jgi:hypothetical protein